MPDVVKIYDILNQKFQTIPQDKDKNQQIEIISYIYSMAQELNKDIADENIYTLFPSKKKKITATKQEVNKILMTYKNSTKEKVSTITKQELGYVKRGLTYNKKSRRADIERKIDRDKSSIASYVQSITTCNTRIADNKIILKQMEVVDLVDNISQQIEEVTKDGFYTFFSADKCCVQFKTNPVVLSWTSDNNYTYTVNLGQFIVSYGFEGRDIQVYVDDDNILHQKTGRKHPHISSNSICYGTLGEDFYQATQDGELSKIMSLTQEILNTYNPEGPYMELRKFAFRSEQPQHGGKILPLTWKCKCGYTFKTERFSCDECGTAITEKEVFENENTNK